MRIARDILLGWVTASDDEPLSETLIPARNYSGLNAQDEVLRVWLPEAAKVGLTEVTNRLGCSFTVYLTEFFASYLYGVHEVMRMREQSSGLYQTTDAIEGVDEPSPAFEFLSDLDDIDDDPEPDLGKAIFSLKIFLPSKIKAGLRLRANKAKVPLGRFVRAMICAHLFGRDVGPGMLLTDS